MTVLYTPMKSSTQMFQKRPRILNKMPTLFITPTPTATTQAIFIDQLLELQALKSVTLSEVSVGQTITLQCVLSHCGIPDHEMAYRLMKEGRECK